MPRWAWLDAPGALHLVMVRGIEQGAIFQDDEDQSEFLRQLCLLLNEQGLSLAETARQIGVITSAVSLMLQL